MLPSVGSATSDSSVPSMAWTNRWSLASCMRSATSLPFTSTADDSRSLPSGTTATGSARPLP